jgi:hypothetical protein
VLVNLGVLAHPETGQPAPDLEGARMTIDILEMIAAKTKGNLTAEEDGALTQILSELRMGYVRVTQSQKPT